MKLYDLFSGIGGFRLPFEQLGYECVGSCEINKYAREIYKHNFGEYPTDNDVTMVRPSELPDFDTLTAGFPCQAFSIAGKRMGFADTRGTMFFEITRIISEKRPQTLLLENVKGLLNHDNGRTFITILNSLDELGYDVEWQVINGKYYVPQNRERVFIIGHLRGKPFKQIFPITESNKFDDGTQQETQREGKRIRMPYTRTIDSNYAKGGGTRTMISMLTEKRSENAKEERRLTRQKTGKDYSSRRDKIIVPREDNLSGCLTASMSIDRLLINGTKIRILTPLECERLMGFPDNWTKVDGISDTQRYKCLGNAVIPLVIKDIVKRLE